MLIIVCWLTGLVLAVAMVLAVINGVVRVMGPVFGPLASVLYAIYSRRVGR
jgi:hypothetical protein